MVIDNLDRVTPEHAKNIWATLQTFFQRRSKSILDQEWTKKIWFIIPFDREGFMRIASIECQITDTPLKRLESRVKERLNSSQNKDELNILNKIVKCFGIVIDIVDENSVEAPQQSTTTNPVVEG